MKQKKVQIILTAIISIIAAASVAAQQKGVEERQLEVKIYLQKTLIDPSGATSDELTFVKRKVDAASPLRAALEALFSPQNTARRRSAEFSIFRLSGMNFEASI